MQAIRTQYKGPTNTKGSRIIATSYKCRSVMAYDYALDLDDNHERAAILHAGKAWRLDKPVRLQSGTLPDGSYAHVIIETKETC
jgi:hypothetical protein